MRVSVTESGTNPPQGLPYVILRLVNTSTSAVMATGQTDTNGEALLAYIGQTVTVNTGASGTVTTPSIAATITAYLLPANLNQPSGWVPDPDDILNNLTAATLISSSQAITVISGQEQSLSFSLTVPAWQSNSITGTRRMTVPTYLAPGVYVEEISFSAPTIEGVVIAHGVSEGNPNLRVGTYLQLVGLGARFSNTYYTTATVHHFDTQGGYETRFTAECAYLGGN